MALYVLTSVSGSMLISADGATSLVAGTAGTAVYYLLEDHVISGQYFYAGSVVAEGIDVPIGWPPTPNVDPLNTSAVQEFYQAGPQLQGLTRTQWQAIPVARPVTYWIAVGGSGGFSPGFGPGFQHVSYPPAWVLTGLGSNQSIYPPIRAIL